MGPDLRSRVQAMKRRDQQQSGLLFNESTLLDTSIAVWSLVQREHFDTSIAVWSLVQREHFDTSIASCECDRNRTDVLQP
jgi:hypothetical protein